MSTKLEDSKNLMIVLSSPSGAGKTTISKKIQQKYNNFRISVSHTTRSPRANEVNGIDYHFVNKEEFQRKINNNEFYEYAEIFDNYYGTSKKSIKDLINNNFDILFDIDWQGTKQLSAFEELNLTKIFILPPNKDELKRRLLERNKGKEESIDNRLKSYDIDRSHWNEYDHILINDNLENCFSQIEKIIESRKNQNLFKFS